MGHADIEQVPLPGYTDRITVENEVELGLAEWRRELVLHDLGTRAIADLGLPVLDPGDATHVEAGRRIERQRPSPGRRLGIAEHHADLHSQLVDEDQAGARLVDRSGQLAQRLRHEPGVKAHVGIPHLTLQLGLRHQCGNRVDHDDVKGAAAHQRIDDLQCLLAAVGLRDN